MLELLFQHIYKATRIYINYVIVIFNMSLSLNSTNNNKAKLFEALGQGQGK
jgi:hypothetical protein